MKNLMQSIGMLAIAVCLSFAGFAQDKMKDKDMKKDGKMKNKDDKFVADIAAGNDYVLWLLEMVPGKAQHEDLKEVAAKMTEDHNMMSDQIREYADAHGYDVEKGKMGKYKDKRAKWEAKRGGKEWDADIMEELVDMHKDMIDMLEDAETDVKDEQLKGWIAGALPMWHNHFDMLNPLKEKVKKPWKEGDKNWNKEN